MINLFSVHFGYISNLEWLIKPNNIRLLLLWRIGGSKPFHWWIGYVASFPRLLTAVLITLEMVRLVTFPDGNTNRIGHSRSRSDQWLAKELWKDLVEIIEIKKYLRSIRVIVNIVFNENNDYWWFNDIEMLNVVFENSRIQSS